MAGCIEADMFSATVRSWTRITRFAPPEKGGHGRLNAFGPRDEADGHHDSVVPVTIVRFTPPA